MTLAAADQLAILDLLGRASYAYDERDLDMLEACFTPDACFQLTIHGADPVPAFEGREAIMALYRDSMAVQTDVRRHVVSNAFFTEVEGSTVVVSSLTLFATADGEPRLLCTGIYRDTVVQGPGGWRLQRRALDLDSSY